MWVWIAAKGICDPYGPPSARRQVRLAGWGHARTRPQCEGSNVQLTFEFAGLSRKGTFSIGRLYESAA